MENISSKDRWDVLRQMSQPKCIYKIFHNISRHCRVRFHDINKDRTTFSKSYIREKELK